MSSAIIGMPVCATSWLCGVIHRKVLEIAGGRIQPAVLTPGSMGSRGHTHLPGVLADRLGVLRVRAGHRFIINVGSVGQPRDGDPRASFGIFDPESFEHRLVRVPYNIQRTASSIREAGLPEGLAKRLGKGA